MASSDGEAVAAPAVGGNGGSRLVCRAKSGGSSIPPCNNHANKTGPARRERQLDSLAFIGQGSDANVYLVRCRLTGRMSALKVQRKAEHEKSVERVHMERQVMVDARHPLVAPLYAAFQDRLYLYLDMEYCPGGSLDNFLRFVVKRNLTEDEARFYAAEITLGLEFLHSKGYVYRDLKAANVLVAASGHIKLTDFGIAERGKLRIETEDEIGNEEVEPARPLGRVQSSPGFVGAAAVSPETDPAHSARSRPLLKKGAAAAPMACVSGVVGYSSSHGHRRHADVAEGTLPPSRPVSHRRASTTPCVESRGGSTYSLASPSRGSSSTAAAAGTAGHRTRYSTFFRRKRQQPVSGATPPRPPTSLGLGKRVCGRFLRRSRGSASTGSSSSSDYSPSSPSVSPQTAEPPGGGGEMLSPSSSSGCRGALPLPPAGQNHVTSPRNPPSTTNHRRAAMRRATVTLGEASWGILSGSPEYMAPEVLMHDQQGSAVDWWGLGILTYELLLGRTPFAGEGGKTRLTFLNIMNKEARFPEPGDREEGDISGVCQQFVRALLSKDPQGRAGSASPVREQPFFSGVRWDGLLDEEPPLRAPGLWGAAAGTDTDTATSLCVPAVENTSGWWWDPEDAIAIEEEEEDQGKGQKAAPMAGGVGSGEKDWWPFDQFNWSERDDCGSGRGGAR